ncbi:hypothetical protein [Pseudorhodoferax soli]|uniref:Uncharacterized protein n=1 Tax=Pseudorhodoferax soli TaxID=545864 RepID=A0A368Y0W6_9BURK|nr:hypothetical protein [Pseudorhodoferax soli]RCW72447.1 hypothetical protein DES41_10352 [Pseudorhodoferax soli]
MREADGAPMALSEVLATTEPAPVVHLQVAAVLRLNLAAFQNAVPALYELAVINDTPGPVSDLTLTISSEPAFLKPRSWQLAAVGAGETYHLGDLDVQLDGALLSRLTESEQSTLRFELRAAAQPGTVLAQHESRVELLARNQWGGIGQLPEMVAAFVQPNDPAVDRVLKAAALALQAGGKDGAIDGYSHGAKRAWELASGIWTAVLQRQLHYALPPASFEHTGQKVRSPGQVLDGSGHLPGPHAAVRRLFGTGTPAPAAGVHQGPFLRWRVAARRAVLHHRR